MNASAKVAVVHEWVDARAGSELVYEAMLDALPGADGYALTSEPGVLLPEFERRTRTTILQSTPLTRRRRSLTLPFMPLAWKLLRTIRYDTILVSSHAFARYFCPRSGSRNLCYVHAPMRYAWTPDLDARGSRYGAVGSLGRSILKNLDSKTVERIDGFAANSTVVATRVREFYGRDSLTIHPPVDIDYFRSATRSDDRRTYLLAAGRFVDYKRFDLAIQTAARLDVPLVLAGSGPAEQNLRALAADLHPTGTTFVSQPPREQLRQLMADASAFLFPAIEDFGIIAVEAQAAGTPVVAVREGGSLDTVVDGTTGTFAERQTAQDLVGATERCLDLELTATQCVENAQRFGPQQFAMKVASWVGADHHGAE